MNFEQVTLKYRELKAFQKESFGYASDKVANLPFSQANLIKDIYLCVLCSRPSDSHPFSGEALPTSPFPPLPCKNSASSRI